MLKSASWRKLAFCAVCLCFAFLSHGVTFAQEEAPVEEGDAALTQIWTDVRTPSTASRTQSLPIQYRTVALNADLLLKQLAPAPMEFTTQARQAEVVIALPMPGGTMHEFRVVESPMMADELAAKFPMFKTYSGVSTINPQVRTRFSWTTSGFSALIVAAHNGEMAIIEPLVQGDTVHHISYLDKDLPRSEDEIPSVNDYIELADRAGEEVENSAEFSTRAPIGTRIKVLRTAVTGTGPFTINHGGTLTSSLAAIVNLVNFSNTIMEHDLAVRMELVANNDQIIFLDGDSDPFVDYSFAENKTLLESAIGWDNFDLGHFLMGGGGGVAYVGAVCNGVKAGGKSGPSWRVFTHEVGHQFRMWHTQNSPNCGGGGAEVGSGVTIMSYAGLCGDDNIVGYWSILPQYHVSSYDQGVPYVHSRGDSCGYWVETGNTIPEVTHDYPDELTIPLNTPFLLDGAATDGDGDSLTYTWDQFDYGPAGHHDQPVGNAPLFRTFGPVNETYRTFPQISDIVNNTTTKGERLPDYERNMHMRLMVHDGNGGVGHADLDLRVTDEAGPFRVLSPNSAETNWQIGQPQTILWDVANTFSAPVSCERVEIQLSTDGGYTYPIELASNVINDGLHNLNAPDLTTNQARVRVMCSDNVFFDISDADFSIGNPCAAGSVVTSAVDGSSGSLRDIVTNGCNGDTITFDPSLDGQTLVLSSTIQPTRTVTIDGEGVDVTISGNDAVQLFRAEPYALTLRYLTLTNGRDNDSSGLVHVGANGHVTIEYSYLKDSYARVGGAIRNNNVLVVRHSTFANNDAQWGAAIQTNGNDHTTIENSTFVGNDASRGGGALNMDGGSTVIVRNVSMSGNEAGDYHGAGVRRNGGHLTMHNVFMINSTGGNECAGAIDDMRGVVIGDNSCGGGTITNTITITVGVLQDNGGSTPTLEVLAGSVSINAGDNAVCLEADQRNARRVDGQCDIGAYEVGATVNTPPTIGGTPVTNLDQDTAYSFTPTSADGEGDTLTFSIENKPNWATFDRTTGALSGTPTGLDIGTIYNVGIRVSDGIASAALAPFDLTVNDLNDNPVVVGDPVLHAVVGHQYAFTPTATDLDYDPISFTISNKPSWATFDPATGRLSGAPTLSDVGTASNILINAIDNRGGVGRLPAFNIEVSEFQCGDVWVLHSRSTGDDSLVDALDRVCDGGLIRFVPNLDGQTIRIASLMSIDKNITIDGANVAITVSGDTDGNGSRDVGIFQIEANRDVTIRNLSLMHGSAENGSAILLNDNANLTLENCTVAHHTNSSRGALQVRSGAHADVRNCSFYNNSAYAGGAIDVVGSISVTQSSFYSNTASWGAAMQLNSSTTNIVNATFSYNNATQGGAALNMDGGSRVSVLNATFNKNRAGGNNGASMRNNGAANLSVTNSILTGTLSGTECTGGLSTNSNNLIHDASCGGGTISGTVNLSPLQDNGGATWTHAVGAGSVTIDAGDVASCPTIDQRGYSRNGVCDLGAYEHNAVGNTVPVISGSPSTTIAQNGSYAFTPTASDADGQALTFSITGLPEWMTFDAATGTLGGVPLDRHVGTSQSIYLTVQDSAGASATLAPFTIEVTNVNDAPLAGLGYGLTFDGVDDYASIDINTATLFGTDQDFTLEVWVKTDETRNDPAILSNKNWNSGGNWGFVIAQTNSTWKFNLDGDGISRHDVNTTGVINDGKWHHLVVTVDRDGDIVTYQDGVEVGRKADANSVGSIDAGYPLNIAQDGTGSYGGWFAGSVGEVRVWHSVRTPSEIAAPYQHLDGNEAGLAGYWDLDEQSGGRIYDGSGSANGSLINMDSDAWTFIPAAVQYEALENGVLNAQLHAYDADEDALTFALQNSAAHGVFTLADAATGAFVYTATPNLDTVTDILQFMVTDGIATASPITVEISISNTNYAPVAGFGRNLTFNGTNQYASIPVSPDWQFGADKDFTIELWVKTDQTQDDPAILGNKNWSSSSWKGFVFAQTGSTWRFNVATGSSASRRDLTNLGVINDGQWHHLAVTADRDGDIVAYQDGVEVGRVAANGLGDINKDFPLNIAQDGTGSYGDWFGGQVDEVRVWHVVRTPQEISATMHMPLQGDETALVGYWPLDEDGGLQIHDRSSNSNHGMLINMDRTQRQVTAMPMLQTVLLNQTNRIFLPGYELDSGDVTTYSLVNAGRTSTITLVDANTGEIAYRPTALGTEPIRYTVADAHMTSEPVTLTVQISGTVSMAEQVLNLTQGWNIVSAYLHLDPADLETALAPLGSELVLMKNNAGQVYLPADNINQIGSWNADEGYQLYVPSAVSVTLNGAMVDRSAHSISLPAGWSIIPHHANTAEPIASGLASLGDALVLAKNNVGQVYLPADGIDQIGNLEPGQGYQIYLNAPAVLTYSAATQTATAIQSGAPLHHFTDCAKRTGSNATVVLFSDSRLMLDVGDEVAVFRPNSTQCVGAAVWTGEHLALTVWGDDAQTAALDGLVVGEQMRFRVWRNVSNSEYGLMLNFADGDGTYQVDGILSAERVPSAVGFQSSEINRPILLLAPTLLFLLLTAAVVAKQRRRLGI